MPKRDGTGPPANSGGPHDGHGQGQGGAGGKGAGAKTGAEKGNC